MNRLKCVQKIGGYYLLFILCKILAELFVLFFVSGSDISSSMSDQELYRAVSEVISQNASLVLLATYVLTGMYLLIKRTKSRRSLLAVKGLYGRVTVKKMIFGALMGASAGMWSFVILRLNETVKSPFEVFVKSMQPSAVPEPLWLKITASIVAAAVIEEVLFRGIILSYFLLLTRPVSACICQALLFATLFDGTNGWVYAFALGLITSLAVLRVSNIKAAIFIRLAFDGIMLMLDSCCAHIFSDPLSIRFMLIAGGILFVFFGSLYFGGRTSKRIVVRPR